MAKEYGLDDKGYSTHAAFLTLIEMGISIAIYLIIPIKEDSELQVLEKIKDQLEMK